MKFDKLEKMYNSIIEKKEKLEQDVKEQEAAKEQKEAEMLAAADAGDLERYKALKAEVDDLDARLFVDNTQLRKIGTGALDEAEVIKAWDKYAAEYGKKFEKMMADYEKARHALFVMYMEIVDFQNEALRTRERCGYLMGMDLCPPYTNGDNYYPALQFKGLNAGHNPNNKVIRATDDTMYFSACGILSDQETIDKVNRVINTHTSY